MDKIIINYENKDILSNITKIENIFNDKIDEIIQNSLPFKINDKLFFECRGSGYYFIFECVKNKFIIGNITTKGGILKSKKFRIHYCYYKNIKILK